MELSFTAGILILVLVYIFREPIKQKAEDVERTMKINSAEDGIETAKRTIEVAEKANKLGDIPNIDDVLKQLHGKGAKHDTTSQPE